MRKTNLTLFIVGSTLWPYAVWGQGCSNASVNGNYGFVATGSAFAAATTGTGGTGGTTTTPTFSSTQVGNLLSGLNGSKLFSTGGALNFDGAGSIRGAATATNTPTVVVGTYTVDSNCRITISLTDAFNAPGPANINNPLATPLGSTSLSGIVINGGSEIELGLASELGPTGTGLNPTPSTTTPTTVPPRVRIQLLRTFFASGCSAASLTGAYGLVGYGEANQMTTTTTGGVTTTTSTLQPYMFVANVRFDGNGNVVSDPTASASPLSFFAYTGTYTVNADCSGTMTLTSTPPATTPPTAGTALSLNFVLTQPVVMINPGVPNLAAYALRAGIQFGISNANVSVFGYGRPL